VDNYEHRGWTIVGARSYQHHCGARVTKRGPLWAGASVLGIVFAGHATALDAMSWLEEHDPSFWSYGQCETYGNYGNVWFKWARLNEDWVFVCHVSEDECVPAFAIPVFNRHLFGKANCAKCLKPMTTELKTRILRDFDEFDSGQSLYAVCDCNYPVWRFDKESMFSFHHSMKAASNSWLRKQRLNASEGTHTPKEMQEILALQKHRCLYCNAKFTNENRPTKDHLLAIVAGGTNWAANIMMSCRRCNSRRGDIPFRTYCSLLSPKQNQRILAHLRTRLLDQYFESLPDEMLRSFDTALAHHDPKHSRFIDIQKMSAAARRNAANNKLLPRTRRVILK
jgi:5-methylcytosine-specific restriction endonuclease McrA